MEGGVRGAYTIVSGRKQHGSLGDDSYVSDSNGRRLMAAALNAKSCVEWMNSTVVEMSQ